MSSKTNILIGVLLIGLLIGGWWIWDSKKICNADTMKDCNGKIVKIEGERRNDKGCVIDFIEKDGERNALTVDYSTCQEKGIPFGSRMEVVGRLEYNDCAGKIVQCFGSGLNIQKVDSIKILENQTP